MIGPREIGALLGVSNAVVIAGVHAVLAPHAWRGLVWCPWFFEPVPTPWAIFLAALMLAMPVGILWGVVLGVIARDLRDSYVVRWLAVTLVGLTLACASAAPWFELLVTACASIPIHTAVLVAWVARLDRAANREVLRVGVREVEAGHRGGRVHRERLGQRDLVVRGVIE